MIKPVSRARFEALCFSREPVVKLYSEEREWYADGQDNVLGTVIFDKVDSDWSYIVLGRNELAKFSAIACDVSISRIEEARKRLHEKMEEKSMGGQKTFPQGLQLKGRKTFKLFDPIVPSNREHPFFVELSMNNGFSPAKEIIAEIAYTFEDPDGNYIEQFQSTGFDARLWELYLYAVLHENDFSISRDYHAPDYVVSKYGSPLVLEATTVNPTQVGNEAESVKLDPDGTEMADYMAIKFANALYAKLQKRYWELGHVKGKPIILAVADFKKPQGVHYSSKFLQEYIYGLRQSREGSGYVYSPIVQHVFSGRNKPSGFFSLPDSENISAVLFSDGGTVSKFNRMGKLAEFGRQDVKMMRIGHRFETATSSEATEFRVLVEPDEYTESWSEGIYIFHNPRAIHPVNPALFPEASHMTLIDSQYAITVPDRFPLWSKTLILPFGNESNRAS